MKKRLLIVLIITTSVYSCVKRNDKIFSASDELYYISLYEEGKDFEILYNGLNTATGTYSISGDTVFLNYTENQFREFDPNEELARKILIGENRVHSIDDKIYFSAYINLDKRKD